MPDQVHQEAGQQADDLACRHGEVQLPVDGPFAKAVAEMFDFDDRLHTKTLSDQAPGRAEALKVKEGSLPAGAVPAGRLCPSPFLPLPLCPVPGKLPGMVQVFFQNAELKDYQTQ